MLLRPLGAVVLVIPMLTSAAGEIERIVHVLAAVFGKVREAAVRRSRPVTPTKTNEARRTIHFLPTHPS
jgi:hypothetical protein